LYSILKTGSKDGAFQLSGLEPSTLAKEEALAKEDAGKRVGQHQRNWGFNLPLVVYMPMDTKNRRDAVREAAMRFPVRRRSRDSAFQSIPLV
jgi:hypothetical protein